MARNDMRVYTTCWLTYVCITLAFQTKLYLRVPICVPMEFGVWQQMFNNYRASQLSLLGLLLLLLRLLLALYTAVDGHRRKEQSVCLATCARCTTAPAPAWPFPYVLLIRPCLLTSFPSFTPSPWTTTFHLITLIYCHFPYIVHKSSNCLNAL